MRSAAPRIEAHYQYYAAGVELQHPDDTTPCDTWVLLGASRYCNHGSFESHLAASSPLTLPSLPFDRTLGWSGPSAILYTDLTSPTFPALHRSLVKRALRGDLIYSVRYRRGRQLRKEHSPLPISGYGVELALKKTDYIVIDDREAAGSDGSGLRSKYGAEPQLVLGDEEVVSDLKPLSKAEVSTLGLNAASLILKHERPFEALVKITQDFPKYSSWIAAHNSSEEFAEKQRESLGNVVPPGVNILWMNGAQLIERQVEPFTLLDLLRRERRLIAEAKSAGLTGSESIALLGHPNVTSAKVDGGLPRFDWTDNLEGGKVIIWLNDLESDMQYEEFPSALTAVRLLPTTPWPVIV